jgi:hypothetical protein
MPFDRRLLQPPLTSQVSHRTLQDSLRQFHRRRQVRPRAAPSLDGGENAFCSLDETTSSYGQSVYGHSELHAEAADHDATQCEVDMERPQDGLRTGEVIALRNAYEPLSAASKPKRKSQAGKTSATHDDAKLAVDWGLISSTSEYPKDRRRRSIVKRQIVEVYAQFLFVMEHAQSELKSACVARRGGRVEDCDLEESVLLPFFRELAADERERLYAAAHEACGDAWSQKNGSMSILKNDTGDTSHVAQMSKSKVPPLTLNQLSPVQSSDDATSDLPEPSDHKPLTQPVQIPQIVSHPALIASAGDLRESLAEQGTHCTHSPSHASSIEHSTAQGKRRDFDFYVCDVLHVFGTVEAQPHDAACNGRPPKCLPCVRRCLVHWINPTAS